MPAIPNTYLQPHDETNSNPGCIKSQIGNCIWTCFRMKVNSREWSLNAENSLLHALHSYFLWLTSISYLASPKRPQHNNELKASTRLPVLSSHEMEATGVQSPMYSDCILGTSHTTAAPDPTRYRTAAYGGFVVSMFN